MNLGVSFSQTHTHTPPLFECLFHFINHNLKICFTTKCSQSNVESLYCGNDVRFFMPTKINTDRFTIKSYILLQVVLVKQSEFLHNPLLQHNIKGFPVSTVTL